MGGVWLANVVAWSLQVAVLVAAALLVTGILPLRDPVWRFRLWQAAFLAAVVLPLPQLWSDGGAPGSNGALLVLTGGTASAPARPETVFWVNAAVLLLVLGTVLRLARLALGWLAVARYVGRAAPIENAPNVPNVPNAPNVQVRVSPDVDVPATVGFWRPVILVPRRFLDLPPAARRAVLTHELLHVRRGDWLRMMAEEVWCALLWFHPLARVLVAQLDLAREMLVDQRVVEATHDRRAYAQALLAFADGGAPAPGTPLIRPSHLSRRVAALAQEVPMSNRLTVVALVVAGLVVPGATLSAVHLWPVSAARAAGDVAGAARAQDGEAVQPGQGVTLPVVTREVKPQYTPAALEAKIDGTVLMAVVVQTDGTVGRVRVTKSLDTMYGLDEAAVAAARQWQFRPGRKDGEPVPVEVSLEMRFTLK